jgi:hypothetical protein
MPRLHQGEPVGVHGHAPAQDRTAVAVRFDEVGSGVATAVDSAETILPAPSIVQRLGPLNVFLLLCHRAVDVGAIGAVAPIFRIGPCLFERSLLLCNEILHFVRIGPDMLGSDCSAVLRPADGLVFGGELPPVGVVVQLGDRFEFRFADAVGVGHKIGVEPIVPLGAGLFQHAVVREMLVDQLVVALLDRFDLCRAFHLGDVVGISPGTEYLRLAGLGRLRGKAAFAGNVLGGPSCEDFILLGETRLRGLVLAVADPVVHAGAVDLVVVLEQQRLLLRRGRTTCVRV